MIFCSISDTHCHPACPEHQELLLNFLSHPRVKASTHIFLLGDIFDVMVGHHKEYYKAYDFFFNRLEELLKEGKEIHYFEGNHDFHLTKLFKTFINERKLKNLHVHTHHYFFKDGERKIYFSHGDDIEIGKFKYKAYKAFIKSYPLSLVANYIIPYGLLDFMGNFASQNSKKNNHNRYNDVRFCEETRELFRRSASKAWEKYHFDYLFCGHAHIADCWKSPEGFSYANSGPSFLTRQFLSYNDGLLEFISL